MHHAVPVRRFERLGDLPEDLQGLLQGKRAARDAIRERLPPHKLHLEVVHVVHMVKGMDDGDVRVAERGEEPRLALESSEAVGMLCEGIRQDFDRHLAVERDVERSIHVAHAASPKRRENFVGP